MSREFNPRETLARLLPSTVQRYFGQYLNRPEVAESIVASDASSETKWNAVPAELQERVIGDLRAVYDLADEKGMKCLLDEARYHGLDLPAEFVDNAGLEDKALAALVASEDVFRVATVMRQADALHGNCWKRWAGLPRGPIHLTREMGQYVGKEVADLFQKWEERGKPFDVHRYLRNETVHYVFIYLADHLQTDHVFKEDGVRHEVRQRHAFDVVFRFESETGILEIWAKTDGKRKETLKSVFCRGVFGVEIETYAFQRSAYHLDVLKDSTFRPEPDRTDGVTAILIKSLTLSPIGRPEELSLVAVPEERGGDVHSLMAAHIKKSPDFYRVRAATLQFLLERKPGARRTPSFTFDLGASGYTNLGRRPEPYRRLGEKYLKRWGIDVASSEDAALADAP